MIGEKRRPFVASRLLPSCWLATSPTSSAQQGEGAFRNLPPKGLGPWTFLDEQLPLLGESEHGPSIDDFICILDVCRKRKDPVLARRAHTQLLAYCLECHEELGNRLVPMLVECGCVSLAQLVFHRLINRNEYSWTYLIQGYANLDQPGYAIHLFQKMQDDRVAANRITFQTVVKACASIKCMNSGFSLHIQIVTEEMEKDLFIASTLIDMYAKCGLLIEAQLLFDELPVHDVVTWTALITGYADHGLGVKALTYFECMQDSGIIPDDVTFICSLKACANIKAVSKGHMIHLDITKRGLEGLLAIISVLLEFYAKSGCILEARCVFDNGSISDVISWTALITGYIECGYASEAIDCFGKMQVMGVAPDSVTFLCVLKACGNILQTDDGRVVHSDIVKEGLETDNFIGNALIDMYAKCRSLSEAHKQLDAMPNRDVISWNSLITGYVDNDLKEKAFNCLEMMQTECIAPNATTLVCILKACASLRSIYEGREIHHTILKYGIDGDRDIRDAILAFYAKCSYLGEANYVLDKHSERTVVSWNAIAAGYSDYGHSEELFNCMKQMQLDGVSPDAAMFIYLLKGCAHLHSAEKGQEIHAYIVREECENHPCVSCSLVDMYAKCQMFVEAEEVLEQHDQSVISWNALMTGYSDQGYALEVLKLTQKMYTKKIPLDVTTCICSLKSCADLGARCMGYEFHMEICQKGYEKDCSVESILVDMYAKCRSLGEAEHVFQSLQVRNEVSWTALISAYVDQGRAEEALKSFKTMTLEGVCPDVVSYACVLKACGNLGAMHRGQELHCEIMKAGREKISSMGNNLVDMYAKCGALEAAQKVFDELQVKTLVSWSSLMTGYASEGKSHCVLRFLKRMNEDSFLHDKITFLSMVNACSHAGLVEEGCTYYRVMKDLALLPFSEHQNCMIDLLGRAGQLHAALEILHVFPIQPDPITWNTMLGASRKWGNSDLGKYALNHAIELDGIEVSTCVAIFNLADFERNQICQVRLKEIFNLPDFERNQICQGF